MTIVDDIARTFRRCDSIPDAHSSRGERHLGKAQLTRFLRRDWTMASVNRWVCHANAPIAGIDLTDIDLRPWNALKQMLPAATFGTAEFDAAAIRTCADYADVCTGHSAHSLLPLMLLCQDADTYGSVDADVAARIKRAHRSGDSLDELMASHLPAASADPWQLSELDRVHLAQLGSGYVTGKLPDDGDSRLAWQFIELINGDVLVLAGYEWFAKGT